MIKRKNRFLFILFTALIVLGLFLIQYNGVFSISIGGANPMLMLCVCISFTMLSDELDAFLFALAVGMITDGAASGTPAYFNTVLFMIISFAVSLTVRYVFNNNLRSAIAFGILCSTVYYLARFFFCVPKKTLEASVSYLLGFSLPSVIYTAAATIPVFLLMRYISDRYKER